MTGAPLRVQVDGERCRNRGMCRAVAGELFPLDPDTGRTAGGSRDLTPQDRAAATRASAACPEGAIRVHSQAPPPEPMVLGRIGLWTFALEELPAAELSRTAAEIEDLGYGTLWFGEAFGREALTQATMLLAATRQIVVATGIACIYGRDPVTMAQAQRTLAGAYPGRFLLGLGLSSPMGVERVRGRSFGRPVETMRRYLDDMSQAPLGPSLPTSPRHVIAALGPLMTRLAAERAWGALSYLAPVAHTAVARDRLGPDALLAVEQAVVLDDDVDRARAVARAHVAGYLRVDHYVRSLAGLGFTPEQLRDGGSDEVVDALVAYGDLDAVTTRVHEHLQAGADHVCLQVLGADPGRIPMPQWRRLAQALL